MILGLESSNLERNRNTQEYEKKIPLKLREALKKKTKFYDIISKGG